MSNKRKKRVDKTARELEEHIRDKIETLHKKSKDYSEKYALKLYKETCGKVGKIDEERVRELERDIKGHLSEHKAYDFVLDILKKFDYTKFESNKDNE